MLIKPLLDWLSEGTFMSEVVEFLCYLGLLYLVTGGSGFWAGH